MPAETLTERATTLVAQMGGLTILAATLSALTAVVYRWYVRELVPRGLSLLVGLSGVAIYLNTSTALGQVIDGSTAPTAAEQALFNIAAFAIAGGGAALGRRIGDQFGTDVVLGDGFTDVDEDVGRLVQSVGRVVAVELPQNIDDVTGYDPMPEETKAALAGRTFLFPRRLTVANLRERLVHRLKTDYAVGHVDVELSDDGTVEYLALGSRAAGIGPTLPPATNAVAIRADPAFAASAGDLVQVWETSPMRRVLTAELRGVADETVTIAIDAADTPKIDPETEYRLVTLPVTDRPDREFASLLRAADETFSSVTVEAGSPLHGLSVGALDVAVVAVKGEDDAPATLPEPSSVLEPGDVVYAIALPEALRRLETAAEPLDPTLVSSPEPVEYPSDQSDQQSTPATGEPDDHEAEETTDEPTTAADSEQSADDSVTAAADGTVADGVETTTESADDESTSGQAGSDSFQKFKAEFDAGEADWDDADGETDRTTADDTDAETESDSPPADESEESSGNAGTESFQDLKAEFDAGEADWDDTDEAGETDDSDADGERGATADTGDADDADGDDAETDELFEDDGLDDVTFEEDDGDLGELDVGDGEDDDLAALDGDDGETLDLDDESEETADTGDASDTDGDDAEADDPFADADLDDVTFKEDDGEDDDDDDDDDEGASDGSDDDDDDSGGGKSFQELKAEFESGEADWEDEVSDSPGGDMRLDE